MDKIQVIEGVDSLYAELDELSNNLWEHPEISGTEQKSAKLFREVLHKEGFKIIDEEAFPNAFYAEYGQGKPVIAVLGEYDALPNLSQKCQGTKEPVREGAPGHACGHNLLGTAALGGAIALKRYLQETGNKGTVRFYGCPEEEILVGKVKMIKLGMFKGCDMAISWHPMSTNMVFEGGYLANTSVHYTFHGKTAHAAFAPELGRSALDAMELMNIGANYLREHVVDKTRIHYSSYSGKFSPNIVPDYAVDWYYVRAPFMSYVQDTVRRLNLVAQGAATMTETTVDIKIDGGCCELVPNVNFADLAYANMSGIKQEELSSEERSMAEKLVQALAPGVSQREQGKYGFSTSITTEVLPRNACQQTSLNSSSDSGDVSQIMPMCVFTTACWPLGCAPHTWQAAAAAGSGIGRKGMHYAAKIIAGIGFDLFNNAELDKKIIEEFKQKRNTNYVPQC